MKRSLPASLCLSIVLLGAAFGQFDLPDSQTAPDPSKAVAMSAEWSHDAAKPGETAILAVVLNVAKPFHVNAHKVADETLVPTEVKVTASSGVTVGEPIYPEGHELTFDYTPDAVSVYAGRVRVMVPVTVEAGAAAGDATFTITGSWQACDDQVCYLPDGRTIEAALRIVGAGETTNVIDAELMAAYAGAAKSASSEAGGAGPATSPEGIPFDILGRRFTLTDRGPLTALLIMLMALVAGLLLNFTPCVLPVVPIKVLSLQQHAGSRRRAMALGLSFSAGVIAAFAILGVLAFGLISGLRQMQWGQLFSEWWFAGPLAVLVAVMGAGMMGAFTTGLPKWVYAINPRQDTHTGSFLFGILTAVLSTPCTAPLFPGALAWALTQSPAIGMGVFIAAGVGMALPYQLLLINPKWIDRLPRTGPGSVLVKQVMGLLLIAVAVYFFGQMGKGLGWWGLGYWRAVQLVILLAGAWLIIKGFMATRKWPWRITWFIAGILVMTAGSMLAQTFTAPDVEAYADGEWHSWQPYSEEAFAQARDDGKIVVVEFTADWCLNCKALEAAVLRQKVVTTRLFASDLAALRVDLTSRSNTAGWAKLEQLGSRGIPLTAIYHPGSDQPILLSSIYTAQALLDAIDSP